MKDKGQKCALLLAVVGGLLLLVLCLHGFAPHVQYVVMSDKLYAVNKITGEVACLEERTSMSNQWDYFYKWGSISNPLDWKVLRKEEAEKAKSLQRK